MTNKDTSSTKITLTSVQYISIFFLGGLVTMILLNIVSYFGFIGSSDAGHVSIDGILGFIGAIASTAVAVGLFQWQRYEDKLRYQEERAERFQNEIRDAGSIILAGYIKEIRTLGSLSYQFQTLLTSDEIPPLHDPSLTNLYSSINDLYSSMRSLYNDSFIFSVRFHDHFSETHHLFHKISMIFYTTESKINVFREKNGDGKPFTNSQKVELQKQLDDYKEQDVLLITKLRSLAFYEIEHTP